MSRREMRMEALKNAGFDTGKYFSFKLTEGLKPGASITLVIDDNGLPIMMNTETSTAIDLIREDIFANGYVKNTKLHRRWVMAHMFRMLNYRSGDGRENGYDAALRSWHGFDYQFKVLMDEVKTLAKLEVTDEECFIERSSFFNKNIVCITCVDYIEKLQIYIESLKTKKCKGVPYKRIKGRDIFVVDLDNKVYNPLKFRIDRMREAKTYDELMLHFKAFMRNYIELPHTTPKCKWWKDAFKGAGAFYTLKNMIMYHDCFVMNPNTGEMMNREDSMKHIQTMRIGYAGEGWRMFALMKKVIGDNDFDFYKRMKALYD